MLFFLNHPWSIVINHDLESIFIISIIHDSWLSLMITHDLIYILTFFSEIRGDAMTMMIIMIYNLISDHDDVVKSCWILVISFTISSEIRGGAIGDSLLFSPQQFPPPLMWDYLNNHTIHDLSCEIILIILITKMTRMITIIS